MIPVGDIRPSQLLWTYGPGALIDLPNLSVMTMGLDRWQENQCLPIEEARLLEAVRRVLGPQVQKLRKPPIQAEEDATIMGVPVRPFPRWLRCVKCGLLGDWDSGLFQIKTNPYRPEDTCFVHPNCKGRDADAVPARFLMACRSGHLDDFPWRYYIHQSQGFPDCNGTMRFFEQGASLQTENLWVKCDGCAAPARSLVHAFGKEGKKNLPACRGRHPHLNSFDESCGETPRAVLLGSTNSWFSVSLSALAIPQETNQITQMVSDGWDIFADIESEAELAITIKTLVKSGSMPGIDAFSVSDLWTAIQKKRDKKDDQQPVKETEIKRPEWKVLTDPKAPNDWPYFLTSKSGVPSGFGGLIEEVLQLQRLREVSALIGFTRVEAPEESDEPDERPPMARLTREEPTWVPANEVYGEGIFIRFSEKAISGWEKLDEVKVRDQKLKIGHQEWRAARDLDPAKGYPGIRYAMLHTFSHLLIREFSLECGYNAASIRERIYSDSEADKQMAGILLYTAAADSDGTLGGLVELGKPENLGRIFRQALKRCTICSSDPLCSEHDPATDRTMHGAACHACGFVPETSCEKGNRYLDRALLVPTFDCQAAAIFPNATWE